MGIRFTSAYYYYSRRLGAVYVKPRHLISDLVSLDTASMWSRCYHGKSATVYEHPISALERQ